MTLNHNYGCFSSVGSGIAGNVLQVGDSNFTDLKNKTKWNIK